MIKRKKILFILTSLVLLISCGYGELPIFVGGSGKFEDKDNFGFKDGLGTEARFWSTKDATIDKEGNLYVTDRGRVRKVTSDGIVTTFTGNGEIGYQDGKGTEAKFKSPVSIEIDSKGNLYVADFDSGSFENGRIRKISPNGDVTTLKIKTRKTTEGKEIVDFEIKYPRAIAIDKDDVIYLSLYQSVYKIIDGVAIEYIDLPDIYNKMHSSLDASIEDIEIDTKNNLYLVLSRNPFASFIQMITPDRKILNLTQYILGRNPELKNGTFYNFNSITIDKNDNLYLSDSIQNSEGEISGSGKIFIISSEGKINKILDISLSVETRLAVDTIGKYLYILNSNKPNINRIKLEGK